MNLLKDLFAAIKESPSGTIMTILLGGACCVYNDFKTYMEQEREEMRMERTEQRAINQQFVEALNSINNRLELIERSLQK